MIFLKKLSHTYVTADVVGVYVSPHGGLCARHMAHVCVCALVNLRESLVG